MFGLQKIIPVNPEYNFLRHEQSPLKKRTCPSPYLFVTVRQHN